MTDKQKIAVVLFNLGGPDSPKAIKPFLFNLFYDKAIIDVPQPIRWFLAKYIAGKRAPVAEKIYAYLGGKSPLLDQTQAQAADLESLLTNDFNVQCFVAMRYWHPQSSETVDKVRAFDPDQIVLLPLYPQYSATTTGSSFADWDQTAFNRGLIKPTRRVCCYPTEPGFIQALVKSIESRLAEINPGQPVRLLFSAHGLPKKNIVGGDPYQMHVEQTCKAVVDALGGEGLDWSICYQSRVGKLEWIGPSTDEEVERAGKDGKAIVLAPIAFVSEHSETLVELDIEYRELAQRCSVPQYLRVPTVGTASSFIRGLADMVAVCLESQASKINYGERCPKGCTKCARSNSY